MTPAEKHKLYKQIIFHLADKDWQTARDWDIVKRTRLLYIFCAMSKKELKPELYSIFNNFYSSPLGPCEADVYNQEYIQGDVHKFIAIDDIEINHEAVLKQLADFKNNNSEIPKHSQRKIIDLTQYSTVWDKAYKESRRQRKFSYPMPTEELIKEVFLNYR